MNVMKEIQIGKVVLNIGVGQGGTDLSNAEDVLERIADQTPVRTHAKQTNQTFEIREGVPVGCRVTLRDEEAVEILEKLLEVKGNEIDESLFDEYGNLSFGIEEHIEVPGMEYDPNVGIYGFNVTVSLERPGFRVKKRRREPKSIPESHLINKDEAIEFVEEELGVKVI